MSYKEELLLKEYETKFDYINWYDKNCYHNILSNRGKEYCGKCGKPLSECNCTGIKRKKLNKNYMYKTKAVYPYNSVYYITLNRVEDYLLIRYYVVNCDEHIGQEAQYWWKEVMRVLVDSKGKIKVARLKVKTIYYHWDFDYSSDLSVLKNFNYDKYDLVSNHIYTISKPKWLKYFKSEWLIKLNKEIHRIRTTRGIISDIYSNSILDIVKMYQSKPTLVETLSKCNRYDLLAFYSKYKHEEVMRLLSNGKTIPTNDLRLYHDYLVGLETLQKDRKNINVLCPSDFESANKKVEKACKKISDEKELLVNINNYNDKYTKRISKLAGVVFGNNDIVFSILPDIKAFKEEADSMCHCVYRMGYYKKETSYIFSVRDKVSNKRLETAELVYDRGNLRINQCYGYGDKFTNEHTDIINLLNKNLKEIRRYLC